jgi:DNA-binding winged helix-turn-helix (wHTH) protein
MPWHWNTRSEQPAGNSLRTGLETGGRRARFGPFELDARTEELWKDGVRVRLQSQPFRILLLLISHAQELVTREEIRAAVWPQDSAQGSNNSINASMNKLRAAIEDTPQTPCYIETLARRGYRFVGSVEWLDRQAEAPFDPTNSLPARLKAFARERKWQVILTSLVLGLLALLLAAEARLAS